MLDMGLAPKISDYIAARGQHAACTLTPQAIERLEWYLSEYFKGSEIVTAETGCGASTILFSQYARAHRCYCLDDRNQPNGSVPFVTNFPTFRASTVGFVFGPTQQTIFANPPTNQIDLVLIDGPHAYPFPDLEYFVFYPWLKPGGILVVDDIQLPTINNLFQFLCQDDSFYLVEVVGATAFFKRTDVAALNQEGDGWWDQRYNVQRFPATNPGIEPLPPLDVPFRLTFDQPIEALPRHLTRGFVLVDGFPTTEGAWSMITLPFCRTIGEALAVELRVEPVRPAERQCPSTEVVVDQSVMPVVHFTDEVPLTLSCAAPAAARVGIAIKLHNYGLTPARDFKDWKGVPPYAPVSDVRLLGMRVLSITVRPMILSADDKSISHLSVGCLGKVERRSKSPPDFFRRVTQSALAFLRA